MSEKEEVVVNMKNFATQQVLTEEMMSADLIQEVIMTSAKFAPTNIVLLALNDEGEGRLYHTQPSSRFNLIGSVYSILHWLTARSGLDGAGR